MQTRQFGALAVATLVVVAAAVALAVPVGVLAQEEDPAEPSEESFGVSNVSAPTFVTPNETVVVTATITNPNDANVTQDVELRAGAEVLSRASVTLPAGDSATVEYNLSAAELALGDNFVGVYTQNEGELTNVTLAESFTVDELSAPANASVGDEVEVTATVTNPNDFNSTQRVDYRFDGDVVNDTDLALAPGESAELNFTLDTNDTEPGDYVHSVFTRNTGQFAVIAIEGDNVTEPEPEPEPENASVSFEDQNSTGESVTVANATLPEGGFIAVLDESGEVVGATEYLENGTSENVSVPLLEALDENDSGVYTAQLHQDTNDNQELDFLTSNGTEDTPYLNEFNEAVADDAEVTFGEDNVTEPEPEPAENASVTFEDQNSTGEEVVVANATLPEGGFIAVLNDTGEVVGATDYLENGTSENVSVPLLEALDENDSGVYTAQLHEDTNDNQELDFLTSNGTEDTPYETPDGEPVADDAEVSFGEDNVTEPEPEPAENASVTFDDQNTLGEELVVANATLPEGGFVAVLNESGEVVSATEYLENGTSEDVSVPLLETLDENDSGTYTAQLHEDTNDNQELDFLTSNGTEDVPYEDESGDPVADDAEVTVGEEDEGNETDGNETDENVTALAAPVRL